jgi:O-methyltransferase
MHKRVRILLKRVLPPKLHNTLRALREWRDLLACLSFLRNSGLGISFKERCGIVRRLYAISFNVESPHTQNEILRFIETILMLPRDEQGVVVEAGCFKGSSTAKFSLAADLAGRDLVIFDSFQGIPQNAEPHRNNIFGGDAVFDHGDYAGSLEEVRANVGKYGKIARCRFIQGWFDETMPAFHDPVATAYLDVDLVSSTRTCLRYLFPRMRPGAVMFSQDGHLPLVIDLLDDDQFWRTTIGCDKPMLDGLRKNKLVKITKNA